MPLQRAQNAAARLVLGLDRRSSTTTVLRDLHWLPDKHRITFFKVATLMHQALHRRCPPYLADLVAFSSTDSQRQLRSTTTRAAGSAVWPRSVEQSSSICPHHRIIGSDSSFRHILKIHLFQLAFNNTVSICFILLFLTTVGRILSRMTEHYNIFIIIIIIANP